MDDRGQMILLSALFACLCLMGVVTCVMAADNFSYQPDVGFSSDDMINARWAQENALQRTAIYDSTGPWGDRAQAALAFKAGANASANNESTALLSRGVVYRFSFNESLASEYIAAHANNGSENIGGVIMAQSNSTAKVAGCAYDIEVTGRDISYNLSRIITFN